MNEQHLPGQPAGHEDVVLRIVADVLKTPHVTMADSFYDFGGTSLQAMRICARIRTELGSRIAPERLFESDTLAEALSPDGD
ncbi:acyl carrier protein [Streptomyces sp. NPDC058646]|uniref:acyl carrier protein n=1 Tax=Streptomyces sp. NPDC058646 TaxID=3346574 RepID=UPI00365C2A99